jgi:pimeloyl-ACP methyl ester carboxylesterase
MLHHKFIGSIDSNQLIIFLHEGLGCIEMWRNYPEKVCSNLKCSGLIYDRAGYGKSYGSLLNRKSNYLHLGAVELYELINDLKLDNKEIILYGHSDGGSIALIFASKYPNIVKAVITEAAHVFVEDITLEGIILAKNAFLKGKLVGLKKYHGEGYVEVFEAWTKIWNHTSFRNWSIEQELRNIICPQLIIQGQNDEYGTLKQVASIKLNTKGKTTTFTPYNCGHSPFKSKTVEVEYKVQYFIKISI